MVGGMVGKSRSIVQLEVLGVEAGANTASGRSPFKNNVMVLCVLSVYFLNRSLPDEVLWVWFQEQQAQFSLTPGRDHRSQGRDVE